MLALDQSNGVVNMTAAVPEGQIVYVSSTGELKYTAPRSSIGPVGGITKSFIYVDNFLADEAIYQNLYWRGPKWIACPVEDGVYQDYAASIPTSIDCLETEMQINARGTRGAPQAYEYSVSV